MNTTSMGSVCKYPITTSRIPLPLLIPEQEVQLDRKFKNQEEIRQKKLIAIAKIRSSFAGQNASNF